MPMQDWTTHLQAFTRARTAGARLRHATLACSAFNAQHRVGVPVRYWPGVRAGDGPKSTTRTQASILNGEPVVWVTGHAGCIALTHIEVLAQRAA
jgi:hypothetical protein